jgi:DNA-binding response OmpR family regulator
LVDALQGKIKVTSRVGQGTVFTVSIPCDRVTWQGYLKQDELLEQTNSFETPWVIPSLAVSSAIEPPSNGSVPILLVVEDNPDLRSYIDSIFKNSYHVIEAHDGQEGLEMALEHIPDVIISDLMMPRLDGFGFCKALKSDIRINHIPVVMLTAKAALEDRLEGFDMGADEYLAKPFNTEELQVRVRNLLKQRQLLQQKYSQQNRVLEAKKSSIEVLSMDEQFIQKTKTILENYFSESSFDVEKFATEMGVTSVQLR